MSRIDAMRATYPARHASFFLLVSLVLAPTHVASAQLGGLAKRARNTIVEQQVDKQVDKRTSTVSGANGGAAPTFDNVTLELTSDRLGQIIRGLGAGRALLDGANASPSRAALVARRDEAANRRVALFGANNQLLSAYDEKRNTIVRCRDDAMRASRDRRNEVAQQRSKELGAKAMNDPVFREKVMAITQKAALAQQRGDSAEVKRLYAELGAVPDDPKSDTLAADKACGREPSRPAVLVQIEQVEAQEKALTEQIRQLEEKAAATEVRESGLDERQFFMARERIEAYLSAVKYKSQPRGFSATELEALGAHRSELEKAM